MITPQDGVVIARRYTLTRPLARGGMGSVWVARHRELEIDVTVKFMDPSLVAEADARARFEHEAKSAARLDSQHVVQVLDYGIENDTPYMVMELLKGETLAVRLGREGRLPPAAAARLVIQVGKALRTAHDAGLVHRDLKPGNVFLAMKDEDEVVKVLDFGIAKSAGLGAAGAGTESGALLGSAHYMSPEQVRSSSTVDARSDLWSLAVILYRALVGRLPFPGRDLGDVLVRVCTEEAPSPTSIAPDLPPKLDGFFARALAREPAQRFQSARELSEAFCSIAMDAGPGVPSSRGGEKRTMRMDLMSVPPAPPSSDAHGAPMVETPLGTQIMHPHRAAGRWPPPPPGDDDEAATVARPSQAGRPPRSVIEPEPTLKAAQGAHERAASVAASRAPHAASTHGPSPVTMGETPIPPAQPVTMGGAPAYAPPQAIHVPDDPPAVPVHALWPAWAALGVLAVGALVFLLLRGGATQAATGSSPAASAAAAETSRATASPPAAASAAVTQPLVVPTASATASPAPSASASAAPVAADETPRPSPQASAAPSGSARAGGRPRPRVVDGIIRDPFAR